MAEGRSRAAWSHTSALLCLLANANRNPKKQKDPFTVADFNPHAQRRRRRRRPVTVERLARDMLKVGESRARLSPGAAQESSRKVPGKSQES